MTISSPGASPGSSPGPSTTFLSAIQRTVIALGLGVALVAIGPVAAEDPWTNGAFEASPRELLAASAKTTPRRGSAVTVLFREAVYHFDAESRVTYRQHLVYRFDTGAGVESWSTTAVDYAPWHQAPPQIRARVITRDGTEHWLDPGTIEDQPAPGHTADVIDDRRRASARLPAAGIGALVEEEVVLRDAEPFFTAGLAGWHPLLMFAPINRARLVLDAPLELPLRYGVRLAPGLEPKRELGNGRVRLVFEMGGLPAAEEPEPGLSSGHPHFPHVAYSTGRDWQSVAAAYARRVDDQVAGAHLDAMPAGRSASGTRSGPRSGAKSRTESQADRIAELLADLRRRVRYTGLELGASSLLPASPDLTLERGFGDCKDQATLLVALLRREEIPAFVTLLDTGDGPGTDPRLPGLGRFDHAVVYVPATPPIWIDPTDPAARAGELPAAVQGRQALVASPSTERLVRTPSADSIDNLTVETRDVHLAGHGAGRIVETSVYHGEPERLQRRLTLTSSQESRREGYLDYVTSSYLAEELGEVRESDPENLAEPFRLTLEALGSQRALTDLGEAVVGIRFENLFADLPEAVTGAGGRRQNPFIFAEPFVTQWRYRIHPPAGFVPRSLPKDTEQRFGPARLSRQVRTVGEAIHLDFRFDSGPRQIVPEQFEDLRRGVRQFLAAEPFTFWLDHEGALALVRGRPREAVGIFRRLAETETEAVHRVRLTQAFLRVGLGEAAHREARRAVELAPSSALVLWSLGFALEHDIAGRQFAEGFHRDEAVAALERAIAIDPENPLPRTELAVLLERGPDGERTTAGPDLDRAAEIYRLLRDELGAMRLEQNLLSALARAHRWQDLYSESLTALARPEPPPNARHLHLAALAILRSAEAAVKETGSLVAGEVDRRALLQATANHLVLARHYAPAAVLLRAAAENAPDETALSRRAATLARTRRYETLSLDTAPQIALAQRLLRFLGGPSTAEGNLEELFHPAVASDTVASEALTALRRKRLGRRSDLPPQTFVDLALAVSRPEVDGDPELGFRVRLENALDGTPALMVYVTRHTEDTGEHVEWDSEPFVIAAIEGEPGLIGREVLRRLGREDLRGAHRWLDWARDELEPRPHDDPYGFRPYARFWTRGTGAFRDKMRLGAAILIAEGRGADDALPILEAAISGDLDVGGDLAPAEVALLRLYRRLGRPADAARLAMRLLSREPGSDLVLEALADALLATDRPDELRRVAEERLEQDAADPGGLRLLARAAAHAGDSRSLITALETLRDAGHLTAADLELWARHLLFQSSLPGNIPAAVPQSAADLAERAAAAATPSALLTRAAVDLELGRLADAQMAFSKALEASPSVGPEGEAWYVLGRFAELFGEAELARTYYRRVPPPEHPRAYPFADLAARRLAKLR